LHINVRGTLGSIVWSPAFEGAEDEIFVCSDHPDFVSSPNRFIRLKQKSTNGYAGIMGSEYLMNITDCIENNKKPFITLEDAVEVLRITDALNRSVESGKVIYL
jgi:hypothetical protein